MDWRPQTLREAGELVMADPAALADGKVVDLSDVLAGRSPGRRDDAEITIYKSVGVGLQDVALAGLAWQRITSREASRASA
jgi:ornithine cyclodeaminase